MQQIELREQLAEVRAQDDPLQVLDALSRQIRNQYRDLEDRLGQALVVDQTGPHEHLEIAVAVKVDE